MCCCFVACNLLVCCRDVPYFAVVAVSDASDMCLHVFPVHFLSCLYTLGHNSQGARISNYRHAGNLFKGSKFELLARAIVISQVSELRFVSHRNYDRRYPLFQDVCLIHWRPNNSIKSVSIQKYTQHSFPIF